MIIGMTPKTRNERRVDAVLHGAGAGAAAVAVAVLLRAAVATGEGRVIAATALYGAALLAMLGLSAAYHTVRHPGWKEALRVYDHAAIYVMIADTYTPFAVLGIGGGAGTALLAGVWGLALFGVAVKVLMPRRFERSSLVLYLALGWIGLPAVGLALAALPLSALVLILAGGLLYTAGVAFHVWETLPYQNALRHAFVLAAAGCHFAAVVVDDVVAA